ncbi:phospho-sugar mutase [Lachnoclostridium phytofermentans]|uniref:Phosphoglucomutase n=1 Tax=Lachnoclostridium phytofermentans (strain ATCC 700394 / DSM 18823 / ISDg) TaxID=357809 RepID=A9KK52_LACP7|nr:phospho-sugar mutase [Lachnoclostridium phytofermentans]ABX42624.1 phosphoglucomutase/phosphomannomutase alpha/beta/alpha domain I [Lachnoclostridium phytofermentans ISDg]
MNYLDTYRFWCEDAYFDEKTKTELKSLEGNDIEIKDRFYKSLEFGTGGLRGIIGAGTNRMNLYTVRKATQGLANFIKKEHGEDRGVAIAYDSRNMSIEFSEEVALCLCANGIKAYRFESLRPTPELSFALRTLNCISGIVITASHNPPEYNGYKVYWEDGAQITYPKDEQIINEVNNVTDFNTVKTMNKEDAIAAGLYHTIGKEIDDLYITELKKQVIHPDVIKKVGGDIKIVYTPLHGTGNIPARRVLSELGFENVYVVPEQELPDGNFSTVGYPNPEDPKAFRLALDLAKKVDADLVLATDPDADRLGVYAKDSKTGDYISFTGNMSGMLICEYLLSQRKENGTIAKDGALIKTIVSTNMADKIAQEYNIQLIEVLTGFKYIGEQIKLFEETGKGTYEFGFEESYGCLIGTHARDKDAIVAVMALCEAAAYYSTKGLTLWDQMLNIYEKYGYFREGLETMTLKGVEGAEKIKEMMESFRQNPPKQLGDYKVVSFRDYEMDKVINLETNEVSKTGLPKSNVLYFELDNDAWVCVRPSGTEPKIKFYIGVKGTSNEDANEQLKSLTDALMKLA